MTTNEQYAKLRWNCRRGMLELDLLLSAFLDKAFNNLSEAEKIQFEQLLACTDQELYYWLVKRELPEKTQFSSIINRILECAIHKV